MIVEMEGGPNGAAIGPDDAAYVCNNGGMDFVDLPDGSSVPVGAAADHRGGSIQRVDLETGAITTLYNHCGAFALNSPIDIVFDETGGFWFTNLGRTTYYARADGSEIRTIRRSLNSPNGIGLSPAAGSFISLRPSPAASGVTGSPPQARSPLRETFGGGAKFWVPCRAISCSTA